MEKKNVYVRAQEVVRELPGLIAEVQRRDRKLADQLRRAAQSVVLNIAEGRGNKDGNAALYIAGARGYVDAQRIDELDRQLDEVCAITWVLSRRG